MKKIGLDLLETINGGAVNLKTASEATLISFIDRIENPTLKQLKSTTFIYRIELADYYLDKRFGEYIKISTSTYPGTALYNFVVPAPSPASVKPTKH